MLKAPSQLRTFLPISAPPPSNQDTLSSNTVFWISPEFECHWQKLESGNWNPEAIAWNPESKTVLDSLTSGDTQHFQMRITYMISCKLVIFEQKMELCVISEAYNLEAYNSVAMLLFFKEPIEIWNAYYLNNFVFY